MRSSSYLWVCVFLCLYMYASINFWIATPIYPKLGTLYIYISWHLFPSEICNSLISPSIPTLQPLRILRQEILLDVTIIHLLWETCLFVHWYSWLCLPALPTRPVPPITKYPYSLELCLNCLLICSSVQRDDTKPVLYCKLKTWRYFNLTPFSPLNQVMFRRYMLPQPSRFKSTPSRKPARKQTTREYICS
jgi:hypothetical protein